MSIMVIHFYLPKYSSLSFEFTGLVSSLKSFWFISFVWILIKLINVNNFSNFSFPISFTNDCILLALYKVDYFYNKYSKIYKNWIKFVNTLLKMINKIC